MGGRDFEVGRPASGGLEVKLGMAQLLSCCRTGNMGLERPIARKHRQLIPSLRVCATNNGAPKKQ